MGLLNRDRLIIGVAALLFFSAFGAVIYLDRSHGTIGEGISQDDLVVTVSRNKGHISVPEFPDDLIILGADQEAGLEFTLINQDEDNDIDTAYISIPGSEMVSASTEWYDPLFVHEWDFSTPSPDMAKIQARDDLPGRNFGGSAMYDVAGNIDDALDHSESLGVDEGITITLEFIVPSDPGPRVGDEAIDIKVSDEKTEATTSESISIDPFPYPYLVVDTDYEFILYEAEGADLDIMMDGQFLFGTGSRASDIQSSEDGYRYLSNEGNIVAVIEAPTNGELVKPVLITRDNEGGQFKMNMVRYKTGTIDSGQPPSSWISAVISQLGYTGILPANAGERVYLDIDGDGLFNENDDDIDGDGIPNDLDTDPYDPNIANHHPSITSIEPSETRISKDKVLRIDLDAVDEDGDDLQYSWSVFPDTGWTSNEEDVEIELSVFDPGAYTFRVNVTDGIGGFYETSVTIDILKAEEPDGFPYLLYSIAIIVFIVLVIILILLFLRKKKPEEKPIGEIDAYDTDQRSVSESDEIIQDLQANTTEAYEVPIQENVREIEESSSLENEPVLSQTDDEPEVNGPQDLENLIDQMNEVEDSTDICPECGVTLGELDGKCPNCGAEFEFLIECPNCGSKVDEEMESCPMCKTEFSGP